MVCLLRGKRLHSAPLSLFPLHFPLPSKNYAVWLGSFVVELGRDKQTVGLYGTAFQIASSIMKFVGECCLRS